ncbi:PREDICTED: jmjC domain-containing protein 4 [Acromyrmex echinatior]|uniref:2-oxoglutarate and iron-dependent oxygenase JMJD4 n=3 Tax=Acromyrmex TaxID=64782 RepID=F4W582_ACREC|nr:PREDICTED: jmjC domain-containing protein 4 [Acromyrmex echinatior]XP_011053909.1 PREDICTED: jmjC domain-containing protein 4 [Acromyrmex echinatior]XP_011053917.1 PREDICTED: jmjC domain-containing protein 4 [Acromyrmex echinatior]XP_011053926.1 PREDICTED: jmjC domain-containing protein 4 [Acromyrmex echinatior]XP_011053934.1 PREDICTED: jmjC domain-containing protein 4 [Acromyrmex echinatior]XP_011053942.1 PREDICTED: jmjC domain-containing protein 4 [Acromyrmex echinatior]EGI70634.1 JmjC d
MSTLIEISSGSYLNEDDCVTTMIERIDSTVTYNDFFSKYLMCNKPCVISFQAIKNWPCRHEWVLNGAPNFEMLRKLFGHSIVPVADCNRKFYNSQFKNNMPMKSYLEYWADYKRSCYDKSMPLLYLKDWHCVRSFSNVPMYEVPQYFVSDWLNEYYIAHPELNDDYMFVYMGPKETWTPLHADVFTSYSWSANIVGKKRWLLFPPHEEDHLRDLYGQLVYDAVSEELNDHTKYKMYDSKKLKCFDVIQEAGEIMFVPSGWHHQVWNLEDTISINHNWINGCNITNVWYALKKELRSVMKEVDDCKDMKNWNEHCQLMLKTSYGMDYKQFLEFISFIAKNRLHAMIKKSQVISFNKYHFGHNHCLFDLRTLKVILENIIIDAQDLSVYNLMCKNDEARILLKNIASFLNSCNIENAVFR